MPRRERRTNADVPIAVVAVFAFVGYVWLLTNATVPVVTTLSFASDNHPKVYAALLAVLVGLPGCLLALPRAFASAPPAVAPSVRRRRQLAQRRRSYLRTDVIGVAALLLAQVPLPAPWGPVGKAATIANVTRSAEVVELSARFATYSIPVLVAGVLAAVLVKVYAHAIAYRVLGVLLAVGAPVLSWVLGVRGLS